MTSLHNLKQEMWEFYNKWRKSGSHCPALNCTVQVSLKGWNHLIRPGGFKQRTTDDVFRRLSMLPHAKTIIEQSSTIQNQEVRKLNGKNVTFITLEAMVNDLEGQRLVPKKVRVIIIEDVMGRKIFLSVMPKTKKKNTRKKKG